MRTCYSGGGQKSLRFHYLESKCVKGGGQKNRELGSFIGRISRLNRAEDAHGGSRTRTNGCVNLTEVRCTRIRLAPFCIRLSKKPCCKISCSESRSTILKHTSYRGERERKRVSVCATHVFLEEKGIENNNRG
jgi:hypothetical protein